MPRLKVFVPATPKLPAVKAPAHRQSAFQLAQGVIARYDYLLLDTITQRQLDAICEKLIKLQREASMLKIDVTGYAVTQHTVNKLKTALSTCREHSRGQSSNIKRLQFENERLRNSLESWGQPSFVKTDEEIQALIDRRAYSALAGAIRRKEQKAQKEQDAKAMLEFKKPKR